MTDCPQKLTLCEQMAQLWQAVPWFNVFSYWDSHKIICYQIN